LDAESRVEQLSNLVKFTIPVDDCRDLGNERDLLSTQIPQTNKEAKKIMKAVAVRSAEAEWAFSLMNSMAADRRNALVIQNIYHLIAVKLLVKSLTDCVATPFLNSWKRIVIKLEGK
jgi:hypothetical protein